MCDDAGMRRIWSVFGPNCARANEAVECAQTTTKCGTVFQRAFSAHPRVGNRSSLCCGSDFWMLPTDQATAVWSCLSLASDRRLRRLWEGEFIETAENRER